MNARQRLISAIKHFGKAFQTMLFLASLAALAMRAQAEDAPIKVWNSGSEEVDKLVSQLVSERPAPFPQGYYRLDIDFISPMPYRTLQVSNALAKLKDLGPPIFPALVKHLGDDRYSYSAISAAWDNWSVGDSIIQVLCDGHDMYCGYKSRKTPAGEGMLLSFDDYLKSKNPEKWAEWAKDKTRLQIQLDFIDWCVEKEKERGFTDEAQKKELLERYEQGRERVKKEYSNETKKSKAATN